jgi:hypothetical protein
MPKSKSKSKSASKLIIAAFIGLVSLSVMVKAEFQVDIGFRVETKSNTESSMKTPQAVTEQRTVQSYSLWAKTNASSKLEVEKESQQTDL